MLTILLPLLPLLLPGWALRSQEASDGESRAYVLSWDGSWDSAYLGAWARPEESLSPRLWACSQLDLSRGKAILGTGLCPQAKVRKLQFSSWEGGDGGG